MKNKEQFIEALNTLFFSWGSDTPSEVIWGANELLDWYEKEYEVKLGVRFKEDDFEDEEGGMNYDKVIEAINNS